LADHTNRLIESLARSIVCDGANQSDGQLLDSFVRHKDGDALTSLVRRHARMVWGVCQRMLNKHHDAEDAFQAVFLVLVLKASTLPDKEKVGNWLYGVAHQTAVRMRARAAKQGVRERQMAVPPEPASAQQYVWNDLQPVLDEELAHLPNKYRTVIVLCDLENQTRKEVARHLDIPEGTVASRLAAARTMLAKRLSRRSIVVSSVLLGSVLSSHGATASVPATVVSSAIVAATSVATGTTAAEAISPTVVALIAGVTKAMFMRKIRNMLSISLIVVVVLGGGTLAFGPFGRQKALAQAEEKKPVAQLEQKKPADILAPQTTHPHMTLTGSDSQMADCSYHRITSEAEWIKIWQRHKGEKEAKDYDLFYNPLGLPYIDFEKCMVIAVFQGTGWNSAGLSASQILETNERIVLRFESKSFSTAGPDGGAKQVSVYAFFLLPRSSKTVVLEEDVKRTNGGPPVWKERISLAK